MSLNTDYRSKKQMQRVIVAISGASGAVFGVRLLQMLHTLPDVETHLVVSDAAEINLQHELHLSAEDLAPWADVVHDVRNIGAQIASGSFGAEAMVIAPCSMKTLASIAHGLAENLIARAADVMLKERRRLILMTRETPLNLIHLRNMVTVTEAGGIVFPPLPAFYHRPESIEQMVEHTLSHVLELLDVGEQRRPQWDGLDASKQ